MTDRYASFDLLQVERPAPGVLRVTMNRPDKMNALNLALQTQVHDIWDVIDKDDEVRVTIITGAGRAFCAGGDVTAMGDGAATDVNQKFSYDFRNAQKLQKAMIDHSKPIVSAINGAAIGAGLAIALLADVSIAASEAKLMDGHLRIGVTPGDHAVLVWPLLCGLAKTKYLLMANETITGAEAERINLVSLSVPGGELAEKALSVATRLSQIAPTAMAMTKFALNQWYRQNQHVFDMAAAFEMVNLQSKECEEAVRALSLKEAPVFPDPSIF